MKVIPSTSINYILHIAMRTFPWAWGQNKKIKMSENGAFSLRFLSKRNFTRKTSYPFNWNVYDGVLMCNPKCKILTKNETAFIYLFFADTYKLWRRKLPWDLCERCASRDSTPRRKGSARTCGVLLAQPYGHTSRCNLQHTCSCEQKKTNNLTYM